MGRPALPDQDSLKRVFPGPVSFWAPSILVSASSALRSPVLLSQAACAMQEHGRWHGFPVTSCSQGGGCSHISPPSALSAPQDNQRFIQREAQHLISSHQFPLSDRVGFPVLRRIVGYPPGIELLCLAGYCHADLPGAVADKFGCQLIRASKEKLRIAVADDLLPLV